MSPSKLWRALIIDDNDSSRQLLLQSLASESDIESVAEASSLPEAVDYCRREPVDLIFTDAVVRAVSFFSILPKIPRRPQLIFVTNLNEFAVRAFEIGATDYLSKPVEPNRLALALQRARERSASTISSSLNPAPPPDLTFVPVARSYTVVPTGQICCLRSDSNYSRLYLTDGREFYVYRTLSEWVQHLPMDVFIRLDRTLIVAPTHLQQLSVLARNHALLSMCGISSPVKIGRTALQKLNQHIRKSEFTGETSH